MDLPFAKKSPDRKADGRLKPGCVEALREDSDIYKLTGENLTFRRSLTMKMEKGYLLKFPEKGWRPKFLAWALTIALLIPSFDGIFANAAERSDEKLCIHHPEHTEECGYVSPEDGGCTHQHDDICGYIEPGEGGSCTHEHDDTCGYTEPEEGGGCAHEHDDTCGYTESVDGTDCAHTHDGSCGYQEAVDEIPCDMDCDETDDEGNIVHQSGCAYTPAEEGSPCTHEHDDTCGYTEPEEGTPCTHEHDDDCGYTEPAEGTSCTHEHDDTCGYTEPEEGAPCTHEHDDTCGYVGEEENNTCSYVCEFCVTDWEWVDEEELLVWNEETELWGLGVPGTDEDNPLTKEALTKLLPAAILAETAAGTGEVELIWELDEFPESAFEGQYTLNASLSGEYVLTEDAPALQVLVALGGGEVYEDKKKFLNQWSFIDRKSNTKMEKNEITATVTGLESKSTSEIIRWLEDTVLPEQIRGWASQSDPNGVFNKVGFNTNVNQDGAKFETSVDGPKNPSVKDPIWGLIGIQWREEDFPKVFKDGMEFTLYAEIPTVIEGSDTYNMYVNSNDPKDYKDAAGNPSDENKDTKNNPHILALKVTLKENNHKEKYLNQWSFIDRDETKLPEDATIAAALANMESRSRGEIIHWLKDTVLPMEIRGWVSASDPDNVFSIVGFTFDENQSEDKFAFSEGGKDKVQFQGEGYKWGHVGIQWKDDAFPADFTDGMEFTLYAEIPEVKKEVFTYHIYVNSNKQEDYRDASGNPSDENKDTKNNPSILSLKVKLNNLNLENHTVPAADPGNVTVNLFDYWTKTQNPSADTKGDILDKSDNHKHEEGGEGALSTTDTGYSTVDDWNLGINQNHLLLFGDGMIHAGLWNKGAGENCRYGKNYAGMEGIVKNVLPESGYPELNLDMARKILKEDPSQDYTYIKDYKLTGDCKGSIDYDSDNIQNLSETLIGIWGGIGAGKKESLQYLFDPTGGTEYKTSYTDVKGLFQLDEEGYYYYNMRENFAEFSQEGGNHFILYDAPATIRTDAAQSVGNFFPFNKGYEVFNLLNSNGGLGSSVYCARNAMNHHLGMTVDVEFRQPANGQINNGSGEKKPMTFEFSGDDDVWVFIDDVLVLDIGGIHSELYGTIDFHSGDVYIGRAFDSKGIPKDPTNPDRMYTHTTLWELYEDAGKEDTTSWTGNTFASNTSHTLKMFYLERGNYDSSIALRFNLQPLLYQRIVKVDQKGQALPDVEFELYPAERTEDSGGGSIRCLYTDDGERGKTFYVRPDYSKSLVNLRTDESGSAVFLTPDGSYFNFADRGDQYYVLKETATRSGYRAQPIDIVLHYDTTTSMLSVANRWTTGAYACSMSNVTSGGKLSYGQLDNDGVFKPTGGDVDPNDQENGLAVAVPCLKKQSDQSWLALYGSNLSGFYSVPVEGNSEDAWRRAVLLAALHQAGAENTAEWHLDWDSGNRRLYGMLNDLPGLASRYELNNDKDSDMHMVYGIISAQALRNMGIGGGTAKERYASLRNYLSTHTAEEARSALQGGFQMLSVSQFNRDFRSLIYIPNEQRELWVMKVDQEGKPLQGTEFGLFSDAACTAMVASGVTDAEGMLIFSPGGNNSEGQAQMIWANSSNTEYYLKETKAPEGYALNNTVIPVIVGTYSIYADAGTADDGVSVMAGVGRLTQAMRQYAMDSDVDVTLQDITAFMQTQPSGTFSLTGWQDVKEEGTDTVRSMNLHFGKNAQVDYGLHDEDGGKTKKPFFVTDTDFIRARVQQNYAALTGGQYEGTNVDVNKDDLGETDLTNLFSLLNIVVVTDQNRTDTEKPPTDEDKDREEGGEEEDSSSEDPMGNSPGNSRKKTASTVKPSNPPVSPLTGEAGTEGGLDTKNPRTGDESRPGLWLLLGAGALAGLGFLYYFKFRKKKDSAKESGQE